MGIGCYAHNATEVDAVTVKNLIQNGDFFVLIQHCILHFSSSNIKGLDSVVRHI